MAKLTQTIRRQIADELFKNSFIPYVVREWNRLSTEIRNSNS